MHVSAGRKRGDLRIYLQSPSGTRSTLLDVRPQDFSSSGFIDWPFMSVHFWGENPSGTWYLEVHNDAYSKWASEAKFFKWSLVLFGTEFDHNDEDYLAAAEQEAEDDSNQEKFNVVRETSEDKLFRNAPPAISDRRNATEAVVAKTASNRRYMHTGCVSKQIHCTRSVKDCRTLKYRNVASVICGCSPLCLEVATNGDGSYNMQCDMEEDDVDEERVQRPRQPKKLKDAPLYCSFIPFFSYN